MSYVGTFKVIEVIQPCQFSDRVFSALCKNVLSHILILHFIELKEQTNFLQYNRAESSKNNYK